MKEPVPRAEGYSAAYRVKLEGEFLGPLGKERLGRAPAWVREVISRMLKEIENRHADIARLEIAAYKRGVDAGRKSGRGSLTSCDMK